MSNSTLNNKFGKGGSRLLAFGNDFKRAAGMITNPRVPLYLKLLLPLGAALYWFWPMDLIPGLPIDDIAVLLIAVRLFISMGEKFLLGGDDADEAGAPAASDTPIVDVEPVADGTWQTVE